LEIEGGILFPVGNVTKEEGGEGVHHVREIRGRGTKGETTAGILDARKVT